MKFWVLDFVFGLQKKCWPFLFLKLVKTWTGNKAPGASVIVWQKNDSNHQKWTFEDEHLISNLNGLAMERDCEHYSLGLLNS